MIVLFTLNLRLNIKKFLVFLNGLQVDSQDVQVIFQETKSTTLKTLKNKTLYAADGGLNHILKNKIKYQKIIWAGDYDSIHKSTKNVLQKNSQGNNLKKPSIEVIPLSKQKDFSDFAIILDKIFIESKEEEVFVEIFYGLGGRRDHELANILEAENFISKLPKGGICFFHGGIVISSLDFKINKMNKIKFSVFSKKENCEIEIIGAKYSGYFLLSRPSHGLSNHAKGSRVFFKPKNSIISVYF